MLINFKCGHPKTEDNIYYCANRAGQKTWTRCRLCATNYSRKQHTRNNASVTAMESDRQYEISRRPKHIAQMKEMRQIERLYIQDAFLDKPDYRHPIDTNSAVVLSDLQIPFEDPEAVEEAMQVVNRIKPDTVILNGDVIDFYQLSDFNKDYVIAQNSTPETHRRLHAFLDLLKGYRVYWLFGNHEFRLKKYIWRQMEKKGPKFLDELAKVLLASKEYDFTDVKDTFKKMFDLDQYPNLIIYPDKHRLYLADNNLIVTHGVFARKHSGDSAKAAYEQYGKSIIVGHSHRLGSYMITQDGRQHGAWENGCLCELEPEYAMTPNWQHGFTVVKVNGPEFHVLQVPIVRRGTKLVAVYG